jgi:hypothetical protein
MTRTLAFLDRNPALRKLAEAARQAQPLSSVLLEGPEGSGKQATALALAAVLLEEKVPQEKSRVHRLTHPDLLFVFPCEANLKLEAYREALQAKADEPLARIRQPSTAIIAIGDVDHPGLCTIRRVRRFAAEVPFEAPRRVVIIADAHRMNRAAANALLKTLEEPPPTAVLLLCSHQTHLLPATVRSRCVRVRVPALDEGELVDRLVDLHGVEPAAAAQIAAVSGGNARRAFDLIDPQARTIATWAGSLLSRLLAGQRVDLLAGAERVAKGRDPEGGKGTKLNDSSLSASRDIVLRTLDFMVADLLSLARMREGVGQSEAQSQRLSSWLKKDLSVDPARAARVLLAARDDLARNVNVGLVLASAFLEAVEQPAAQGEA